MLCLTCTMISSGDLVYYRVSRAKDWVYKVCIVALLFYVHGKHLRSCRDGIQGMLCFSLHMVKKLN